VRAGALLLVALAAAACGKPPEPKVDAATERAEATERAKKDVFGTQVKAYENAKGMQDELNAKVQANVDAAEKNAK
jgi:hypothetical protein